MLGGLQVSRGKVFADFRTKKTASLFGYLAFTAGRELPKDILIDAFWPETDVDRGRGSLRTALSALRTSLQQGEDRWQVFDTGLASVRLNVDHFWIDAVEFAALARTGESLDELTTAFELYQGPLLQGFHDPWIMPQALDLEETYVQLARKIVDMTLAEGDPERAVSCARRALTICPEREELHVAQMLAYSRAGMGSAVIRQFELLESMLDDLWGERPSPEALAILNGTSSNAPAVKGEEEAEPMVSAELRIPSQAGGFFGRGDEVAALVDLLQPGAHARLVTLTGLGGCGKTRLAEAVALALDDVYSHRTWLVQLAHVRSSGQVAEAVAAKLCHGEVRGDDLVQLMSRHLGSQPALIVLDNLEHLMPEVVTAVEALIVGLPSASFLATSRVPTGLSWERAYAVGPLPCPKASDSLEVIRSSPSAQLLVESAQAVRPGFEVRPVNARAVAELCRKLEGIPLAIRLAASRLSHQTPAQVLGAIARRIDLSHPLFEPRQSSLKAVVEWNVDLLDTDTKRDLARLSVCRDGIGYSLARELLGSGTDGSLAELVRTSLLAWTETEVELRYSMLETVREVAVDSLAEDGRLEDEAKARHFQYCLALCCPRDRGPALEDWLEVIELDIGNIIAALDPDENPSVDPSQAWAMLDALQEFVWRRGRIQVFADCATTLLAATETRLSVRQAVRANQVAASFCYGLRDIERTFSYSRRALDLADSSGDDLLRATTRVDLAIPSTLLGHFPDAVAWLKEALDILDGLNDASLKARCLLSLAWTYFDGGDELSARPVFEAALETAEGSEDQATVASCLVGLAVSKHHDPLESSHLFDRAESIRRRQAHMERIGHCLYYRAYAAYRQDNLASARDFAEQAFRVFLDGGVRLGQVPLTIVGNIFAASHRAKEAALLWGRADGARVRYGMRMFPLLKTEYDREEKRVLQTLPRAELNRLAKMGSVTADDELVELVFQP